MAIAEVGSGTQRAPGQGSNFDSFTIAFPASVTAGNLLAVVGSCWNNPVRTSIAVTDTRSTPYTTILGAAGAAISGGVGLEFIAYGIATSSGACTVTIDPNGTGNYCSACLDEFSGVHAAPLDVDGGESTGTSTAPSDGLTTGTDGALILAVVTHSGGVGSYTVGSGYTMIDSVTSAAIQPYAAEFQVVGAAGAYTAAMTLGSSSGWAIQTAAFKVPGAAADGLGWKLAGGRPSLAGSGGLAA